MTLLMVSILLLGCSEKEQEEFTNAVIKDSIDQANPFHPKNPQTSATPTPTYTTGYDDRTFCSEPGETYVCVDGTIYNSVCDGVWEWKKYVGPIVETCSGYYQKISCNGNTLVDTGYLDEQTYCLASGAQLGRTFCRDGQVKHEITDCEQNSQVCKDLPGGAHQCMSAPPAGYCDYDYVNGQCPISCVPSGNSEPGKQCIQAK